MSPQLRRHVALLLNLTLNTSAISVRFQWAKNILLQRICTPITLIRALTFLTQSFGSSQQNSKACYSAAKTCSCISRQQSSQCLPYPLKQKKTVVVCVNVIANFHPTARPILIENVNTLINTHTHAHICICNVVLNAAAALINIIRLETFLPDCLLGFARFVLDAAHRRFNASAVQLIGCKVLLISL